MTDLSTRREFLARSALLAAGVCTLPLIRPAPSFSRSSVVEDLVDAGETFRRGGGRGVTLGAAPDGSPALRAAHDGALFASRVLQSSMGRTHVGLHWSAAVPQHAKLSFEVRTDLTGPHGARHTFSAPSAAARTRAGMPTWSSRSQGASGACSNRRRGRSAKHKAP